MDAKTGDKDMCSQCGKEIVFVGPYWDHPGEIKPRHPAIPVSEQPLQPAWWADLDSREHSQIIHAQVYARDHIGAGAPGHGQFILIAKLAKKLDDIEQQAVRQ